MTADPATLSTGKGAAGLPQIDEGVLAHADPDALLVLLGEWAECVPRALFAACVQRGPAMVQALQRYCTDLDGIFAAGEASRAWWTVLHGLHILGEIPGPAAGELLIDLLTRIDGGDGEELLDGLTGNWPHLFANKPAAFGASLRRMMNDQRLEWGTRANAASAVVAAALALDAQALETAIDEVAAIAARRAEDAELRLLFGLMLMDFARTRHGELLMELVALQDEDTGRVFTRRDVRDALARGSDQPEWLDLPDIAAYYSDEAVAARIAAHVGGVDEVDVLDASPRIPIAPFVRTEAKCGRNDPCPCGSGRKYKQCCL